METTTLKEVEGAMPQKNDFEYARGLDSQGNPIRIPFGNFNASKVNGHRRIYQLPNDTDTKFMCCCTLKVKDSYVNAPISFELIGRRSKSPCIVNINFINQQGTDPDIDVFSYGGDYTYGETLRLYKTTTSTWELWLTQTKSNYEYLCIANIKENRGVSMDFTIKTADTLPQTATSKKPNLQLFTSTFRGNLYNDQSSLAIRNSDATADFPEIYLEIRESNGNYGKHSIKFDRTTFAPFKAATNSLDLGNQNGGKWKNLYLSGQVFQNSDETLKDIQSNVSLTLEQIANTPNIKFKWKPITTLEAPVEPKEEKMYVGTTAQYVKSVLPEVVTGEEGNMSVDYATAALIFAVQTAKHLETANKRIADLEARIAALEAKQ